MAFFKAVAASLLTLSLVVVAAVLAGSDVRAADHDGVCGAALSVVRDGSAYAGGEYRVDQEEFDDRCLAVATPRVRLAAGLGLGGLLVLPIAVVLVRRAHAEALVGNTPEERRDGG
ncbi:MAG: hypothetical protein QM621_05650 [Aeromicrobium sp.]|uniref:hypothetical protein n=1 Tax=Aeromicrobium sp. TaxID=1871063 RepID=UPI0039E52C6D